MKLNSIKISKGVVYFMAIAVISILTILIPELLREEAEGRLTPPLALPVYITAWIYSLPIFFALFQTLKLINLIEIKNAFSNIAVEILKKIKYSSLLFCIMVVVGVITQIAIQRNIDPLEDTAPLGVLGIILTFVSSVITAFLATLEKLLSRAIDIKSENELTV